MSLTNNNNRIRTSPICIKKGTRETLPNGINPVFFTNRVNLCPSTPL